MMAAPSVLDGPAYWPWSKEISRGKCGDCCHLLNIDMHPLIAQFLVMDWNVYQGHFA